MRRRLLSRALFVLYCIEAGVLITLFPWSRGWEAALLLLPPVGLRSVALGAFARSAVSGFGLVHLVWGAHDLELLFEQWKGRPLPARPQR